MKSFDIDIDLHNMITIVTVIVPVILQSAARL